MKKLRFIFWNFVPILVMIGFIPIITNDYLLAVVYIAIIIVAFWIKLESKDLLVLAFGFIVLAISEWLFVSTGVETFTRRSLYNIMPIWLPILWGYAFVAIKRAVLKI
jgi:hypothetical protein